MGERVLYAGDGRLDGAASYLAGVLAHHGLAFDHVPSGQPLGGAIGARAHAAYVFSDYPASALTAADCAAIERAVRAGAGLVMIGGWESFHGAGGGWQRSPLAEALPVRIADADDRVNAPQPVIVEKLTAHPIVDGLPFDRPPCVGGYNRVQAGAGATVVLAGRRLAIIAPGPGEYVLEPRAADPLLVVGACGRGRTAAFTSDVAPHWVGGMVDWGTPRVAARAPGGKDVEVGCHYAEFFARLVRWAMGESAEGSASRGV